MYLSYKFLNAVVNGMGFVTGGLISFNIYRLIGDITTIDKVNENETLYEKYKEQYENNVNRQDDSWYNIFELIKYYYYYYF
jgi:hypothetical protein